MKNGVPFHTAMDDLSAAEAEAYGIIFGTFEGGRFNFTTWAWEKPDT